MSFKSNIKQNKSPNFIFIKLLFIFYHHKQMYIHSNQSVLLVTHLYWTQ